MRNDVGAAIHFAHLFHHHARGVRLYSGVLTLARKTIPKGGITIGSNANAVILADVDNDGAIDYLRNGINELPVDIDGLRYTAGAQFSITLNPNKPQYATAALRDGPNGEAISTHFRKEGINTRYILTDNFQPTGTALIFVSIVAENCIAVAHGANYALTPTAAEQANEDFKNADVLVMQAEPPYDTIAHAAALAKQCGCKVLLNPAPACEIDDRLMSLVDIPVVNEAEATACSGSQEDDIESMAAALIKRGAGSVVITLGGKGAYALTPHQVLHINAFKVDAIDTTGTGDTFCGALAVECARQPITKDALTFACAAAAPSVTKAGAQPSIPTRKEVENFLLHHH